MWQHKYTRTPTTLHYLCVKIGHYIRTRTTQFQCLTNARQAQTDQDQTYQSLATGNVRLHQSCVWFSQVVHHSYCIEDSLRHQICRNLIKIMFIYYLTKLSNLSWPRMAFVKLRSVVTWHCQLSVLPYLIMYEML